MITHIHTHSSRMNRERSRVISIIKIRTGNRSDTTKGVSNGTGKGEDKSLGSGMIRMGEAKAALHDTLRRNQISILRKGLSSDTGESKIEGIINFCGERSTSRKQEVNPNIAINTRGGNGSFIFLGTGIAHSVVPEIKYFQAAGPSKRSGNNVQNFIILEMQFKENVCLSLEKNALLHLMADGGSEMKDGMSHLSSGGVWIVVLQ